MEITVDDNIVEYLDIGKTADCLRIGLDPFHSYSNVTLQARITRPLVAEVSLEGASHGRIEAGFGHMGAFRAQVAGAGRLDLAELKAASLTCVVSGAGTLVLTGLETDGFNCTLSGAGSASATGQADTIRLSLSGASNADVYVCPARTAVFIRI